MIKIISGMLLATLLLAIGFWAGMMVNKNPQPIQVAMNDSGFNQLLKETADHMNMLPTKGK